MRTRWRSRVSLLVSAAIGASLVVVASPALAAEPSDVVINEVETSGGSPGDWIELANTADTEIDVSGWWVEDGNGEPEQLGSGLVIPAHGYLALDEDVHFTFGLGKDEVITIYAEDGTTVVDSASFPGDHAPTTIGRCPDGAAEFSVTSAPTKGAANECPTAADVVRINEVETQDGDPDDWVELTNTGTAAVDAGGLQLADSGNAPYVIPAATTIPASGHLVIERDQLGFGFSGDDSVTLYDTDGITEIDAFAWTAHAAATYGRCPDGLGDLGDTAAATKGAANDCAEVVVPGVVVNEVDTSPDWVEIANPGDTPVDLEGWWVSDANNAAEQLTGDVVVPANGYLLLEGDDADFGFGLGRDDEFHLVYSDGFTEVDAVTWVGGHPVESFSRCPDGSGALVVTPTETPGAANDCAFDMSDRFAINEIESDGGDPGDWVELVNTADEELDAGGLQVADSGDAPYTIPSGTMVPAGGFLVLERDVLGFGLGGADSVTLLATDGETVVDVHSWTAHADESYGRCPDGVGPFAQTEGVTKGAANQCPAFVAPAVVVNEVETQPTEGEDWVEFYNPGEDAADLSGFKFQDADPEHDFYVFPRNFVLEPGGFHVVHGGTPGEFPHGLGDGDSAILYAPDGETVVDSYSWGPHATTTYGRCPDGTGDFTTTTEPTKGSANDCGPAVAINEIESRDAGEGPDWVELANAGTDDIDLEGWTLRDEGDDEEYTFGAVTLAPGAYLVVEQDETGVDGFEFGLGGDDSVRLFDATGAEVDAHTYAGHAATTYGRCPDTTGDFAATAEPTPGAANVCEGDLPIEAWPGGASVVPADVKDFFGGDMSGLVWEGTGPDAILWAVNNDTGTLYKLTWNGEEWVPVTTDGWSNGKPVRYPGGGGVVDAEGVTILGGSSESGVYIASERNDDASSVSRPSILRVDVSGSGSELVATNEWNLGADLARNILSLEANQGLEGIAWIPDSHLVAHGLVDDATGELYDPADYPGHGSGLFFVAVEADGGVYGYALDASGGIDRVTRFDSGFPGAMELVFDPELQALWVVCDELCEGTSGVFTIAEAGEQAGGFVADTYFARPAEAPDVANEGFAIAPQTECVEGVKPVVWADDSATDGHALRAGTIRCTETGGGGPVNPAPPSEGDLGPDNAGEVSGPESAQQGETITVFVGTAYAGEQVDAWILSTPVYLGRHTVSAAGTIAVTIPATFPTGEHRIVIVDVDGNVVGWYGLEVTAAGALATTGASTGALGLPALLLLLGGVILVTARRRRTLHVA